MPFKSVFCTFLSIIRGSLYRRGVAIREAGERAGRKRRIWAGAVIRLGLALRDYAAAI